MRSRTHHHTHPLHAVLCPPATGGKDLHVLLTWMDGEAQSMSTMVVGCWRVARSCFSYGTSLRLPYMLDRNQLPCVPHMVIAKGTYNAWLVMGRHILGDSQRLRDVVLRPCNLGTQIPTIPTLPSPTSCSPSPSNMGPGGSPPESSTWSAMVLMALCSLHRAEEGMAPGSSSVIMMLEAGPGEATGVMCILLLPFLMGNAISWIGRSGNPRDWFPLHAEPWSAAFCCEAPMAGITGMFANGLWDCVLAWVGDALLEWCMAEASLAMAEEANAPGLAVAVYGAPLVLRSGSARSASKSRTNSSSVQCASPDTTFAVGV